MVFEEIGAALRRESSKALCRRVGKEPVSLPQQTKASSHGHQRGVHEKPGSSNWRVAERLFSPRLRRDFEHICVNELSPATVITATRMPGMLALPGWPLRGPAPQPRQPAGRWQPGDKEGLHLPGS